MMKGRVAICTPDARIYRKFFDGSHFGEYSLFTNVRWVYSTSLYKEKQQLLRRSVSSMFSQRRTFTTLWENSPERQEN